MMIDSSIKREFVKLVGNDNYLDSVEDRICYAFDASRRKRMPDAVMFPQGVSDVSAIMKIASINKIPVVPRGGGSGMSGGSVPIEGGIVLVMGRFTRIIDIDTDNLLAIVEPGVTTSKLHLAVEKRGLFYPPDPASMSFSTIGGNISENSGGMRAVKYGVTKDYVMGLEVVLPTGVVIHTGSKCVKDVVGYNLTQLFVGSEGTLGIVTKAILKLLPLPEGKLTLTAAFSSMEMAAKTISEVIKDRIIPTTLEFLDKHTIRAVEDYLRLGLPSGAEAFLLIEVDGDVSELPGKIERIRKICECNRVAQVNVAKDKREQEELWKARRAISASLLRIRPEKLNEDIVVPRSRIPNILTKIENIGDRHGLVIPCFGHAGDGNIHVNVMFGKGPGESDRAHQAVDEIFEATVELEGRISGEHGIGITKQDYLGMNIEQPVLDLMRNIKEVFDPGNILNPGKIFPPNLPPFDKGGPGGIL